jgi:hypothetical protein
MLVSLICAGIGQGFVGLCLESAGAGMFGGLLGLGTPSIPPLHGVIGMMIGGFFLGGMVRMAVNQVRGRRPRLEDLFSVTDVWFDLVLGSFLLGVPLMIGWDLLIVPGLIVAGLLMFMYPLIVDGRLPATGAIIRSFHALKSQWLVVTIVHLGIAAVAGAGVLLGGIGLVFTGPLYALSLAVLYRDLFLDPYSPTWDKPHDPYQGDF